MRRLFAALIALAAACGQGGFQVAPPAASAPAEGECADAGAPPSTIACTGLYADVASKTVAPGVRPYAPAATLWSDGAEKSRWIALGDGAIDATNPGEWVFPVGTKAWKEFRRDGRRVETRLFAKVAPGRWVYATYAWSDDESRAVRSFGGDLHLAGGATYHVPTPQECDRCHRGRSDRLLGFDAVLLGLPGASGVTLADLANEGRLAPAPPRTSLVIGDDGTGRAAPALAWLHANCGVACHNDDSNAEGYAAGMHLRLDPRALDGRSARALGAEQTTVGVPATTPSWSGIARIVPGDPAASLIVQLVSERGDEQMPPLATRTVDTTDVAAITGWIAAMQDADAGADAEVDAETGTDAEADADAETDAEAEAGADAGMEAEADAEVDARADAEVDARADAHAPDAAASDAAKDAAHRD